MKVVLIFLFFIALCGTIAFFVFEIKMLIHAIRNPIENKVWWILAIVLFSWAGTVVYYYYVYEKYPKVPVVVVQNPILPSQG